MQWDDPTKTANDTTYDEEVVGMSKRHRDRSPAAWVIFTYVHSAAAIQKSVWVIG